MITIKIGGSVVDDLHPSVVADIKKVVEREGVILVHGGGKEVTKVTEQLGKEPKFVVSPWLCLEESIKRLLRCCKKMESMQ